MKKLYAILIVIILGISIAVFLYLKPKLPTYPLLFEQQSNISGLYWELIPNFEQKFDGFTVKFPTVTTVKINSAGFRDYEYNVEKPNNTFRIVVLGDSFTFGWGVKMEESYPKVLERMLNGTNSSLKYEVLNFGMSTLNTQEEVDLFYNQGMKYNPDMIVIGYLSYNDYFNDTRISEMEANFSYENNRLNRTMLAQAAFIEECNKKPFEFCWKNVEMPLSALYNITRQKNITVLVYSIAFENDPRQTTALQSIASAYGWYFLNAEPSFKGYDINELRLSNATFHPSALAHQILAKSLYDFLTKNKIIKT